VGGAGGPAVGVAVLWLDDALTSDGELTIETESGRADELIAAAAATAGAGDQPREWVVVEATDGAVVGDAAYDRALGGLRDAVDDVPGVDGVVTPLDGVPGLASTDGTYALLQVTLSEATDEVAADLVATLADREPVGFRAVAVGDATTSYEFDRLAEETLVRGELLGLSAALVILVVVFGALVAAVVPLVLAVLSVVVAVGLTALVGQVTDLSLFVVNMITMIGLAVGIDYSLFAVQRFREERRAGLDRVDAITVAGSTATRAVVFSGVATVWTGACGLA
jgi:RND superfamily putative drug exporter